jgi:hypothetical protein
MRRSEELERLAKRKELWNKENRLSKEEQVASWIRTIEALEKIYKGFYSYKDYRMGKFKPELVWRCEGDYKDEDKAVCKNEVIKILKLCKKEDVLINRPAVANLIYVNRLNKRDTTKSSFVKEEQKEEETVSSAQEKKSDDTTEETNGCDGTNLTSEEDEVSIADNKARCIARIREERDKWNRKK